MPIFGDIIFFRLKAVIPEIYIEDVPRDERVNPDIYIPQRQSGLNRKTIADGLNERYLVSCIGGGWVFRGFPATIYVNSQ